MKDGDELDPVVGKGSQEAWKQIGWMNDNHVPLFPSLGGWDGSIAGRLDPGVNRVKAESAPRPSGDGADQKVHHEADPGNSFLSQGQMGEGEYPVVPPIDGWIMDDRCDSLAREDIGGIRDDPGDAAWLVVRHQEPDGHARE